MLISNDKEEGALGWIIYKGKEGWVVSRSVFQEQTVKYSAAILVILNWKRNEESAREWGQRALMIIYYYYHFISAKLFDKS